MTEHNGMSLELGRILERIAIRQEDLMRITEKTHDESIRQTSLMEQMSDGIGQLAPKDTSSADTQERARISGLRDLMDAARRLAAALVPIILLALLAAGKISWVDVMKYIAPFSNSGPSSSTDSSTG